MTTNTPDSKSLGTEYPKQQARVREALGIYKSLGPAGVFAATWIEELLQRADRAAIEGDVVAMIGIYQEMCEVKL